MLLPHRFASLLFHTILWNGLVSVSAESISTTANPAINQYSCPSGFDLDSGQCRRASVQRGVKMNRNETLKNAVDVCNGLNAIPPIIKSDEDHNYWKNSLRNDDYNDFPLGIICDVATKKYVWMDGTTIDYRIRTQDERGNEKSLDDPCSQNDNFVYFIGSEYWGYVSSTESAGTYSYINICCIANLKKPEIREDDCIQFDHDVPDSTCFQVSQDAELWTDAQDKCKSVGANLASVHNAQENAYIRRLAVSNGLVGGLQLGATMTGKTNTFGWIDGSQWNYTNFLPGFPMDGFGDCLTMSTGDTNGEWANSPCTSKFPFICSRKPFTDSPPNFCRGADIKEGDIVRTPGFPADATTYCDFFLQVDPGKKVEIEIILVEANTCCDHFVLYEVSSGYTLIANLTGAIGGVTYRTMSSNLMRASWQPNGAVNVRGAMFTFRGV